MKSLVLLRHGESVWNKENRFTGWTDVELSEKGVREAQEAGRLLRDASVRFDVAFTSLLKRAIKTLWLALEQLDQMWLPIHSTWRLNERHYGDLQGLNKAETAARFGEQQVKTWRRSYDIPPPPLKMGDPRRDAELGDPRYSALPSEAFPVGESLADTVDRFLPCWHEQIAPALRAGKRVLVAAHGNSLRALVMYLGQIPRDQIVELNIPTGIPLVYELDDQLRPLRHGYLGDPEAVSRAAKAVAAQGAPAAAAPPVVEAKTTRKAPARKRPKSAKSPPKKSSPKKSSPKNVRPRRQGKQPTSTRRLKRQ